MVKFDFGREFVIKQNCDLCASRTLIGKGKDVNIDSKDCDNIDKALEEYEEKFEESRVLLQLRERQAFTKPSVKRRTQVLKAVYKQQLAAGKLEI